MFNLFYCIDSQRIKDLLVKLKPITTWLKKYCKIWEKFEDSPGRIENAYGHLWRAKYGRDQLLESLYMVDKDPSSRQNLVMAWDPSQHGLENQGKYKNVPCPFAYQVLVQNKQLNMIVYVRSSDAFLGLPYDIGMYSLLSLAYTESLGLEPGIMTFMLGDVHLYENQYEAAQTMINIQRDTAGLIQLPQIESMQIGDIIHEPDKYVQDIVEQTEEFEYFDFNPKVEVVL